MIGSKNTGSVNGSGFFVCLCLFLFFWLLHVGSFMFQFSNQGLDPCLLQWKRGALTTALPGKSRLHISERKVSSKENQPSMSSPFHFKLTGFSSFPSGLLSTFHNWFLMQCLTCSTTERLFEKDLIVLKLVNPFCKSCCSLGSPQGRSFKFLATLF